MVDRDAETLSAQEEELKKHGVEVHVAPVDVGNEELFVRLLREWVVDFPDVSILVNCAGIMSPPEALVDTTSATWFDLWKVNCLATYLACREVAPFMIEGGYGRIVNVSSAAGKEGNAMSAAYSASKAAVIGLTKAFAKEVADKGVLVNAVTPGVVQTDMLKSSSKEHVEMILRRVPMGRMAAPEEVSELICWLASRKCSYSSGAVFDASGGRASS